MNTTDFKDITYELDAEGIVTLTLNTPKRKNALSALTFLELWWAIDHFERNDKAHALIVTGARDPASNDPAREAFSSGGYFSPDAFDGVPEEVIQQIDLTDIAQKKTTLKLHGCDKPVLAAVNGLAIGGAFTLILATADQIYLSEHAWAQLPFAKLGISAELGSTYLLPRLLGQQKAKEILFFGDRMTAPALVELGLANAVVAHDELMAFTRDKALQLIPPRGAGLSIREMKRMLHQQNVVALSAALDLENGALSRLMGSADFAEGMTARIERREACFTGK
jgi:enoyl-CoA hydratase/carnithine racemase